MVVGKILIHALASILSADPSAADYDLADDRVGHDGRDVAVESIARQADGDLEFDDHAIAGCDGRLDTTTR